MISGSSVPRALAVAGLGLALSIPGVVQAQECEGSQPRGGMWSASGELYIDRARRNTDPEDRRELYQQAVDVLTDGFSEQPENPRNFLMAGQAYAGLDEYGKADSVWTVAENMWSCYRGPIDTMRFNAWVQAFNRGVQYSRSDDVERAITEYEKAYTIYRKQPQSTLQLGNLYAQRAQMASGDSVAELQDQAVEYFEDALVAIGESQRLSEEDRREYRRAATFNLAQILAVQGRYGDAAEAFDAFLEEEPDNPTARTNLAIVLTQAADALEDSLDAMEEGAAGRSELEARVDSLEQAAGQHYADLLARDDLEADDYHNIGVGLQRVNAHDEAASAFGKALDLAPYRAGTLEQLALTLFNQARYDTLAVVGETLVARYPYNMNNLAILANAYRELDRPQDALRILEQREALPFELLNLAVDSQEGMHTVSGHLSNRTLEPGAPIQVEFELRDPTGEVVGTIALDTTASEQGVPTPFSVQAESSAPVSGFTYRVLEPPTATDGEN